MKVQSKIDLTALAQAFLECAQEAGVELKHLGLNIPGRLESREPDSRYDLLELPALVEAGRTPIQIYVERYRPNFVVGFPNEIYEVAYPEQLVELPFVKVFKESRPNFYRFGVTDVGGPNSPKPMLLAQYDAGINWAMIAYITGISFEDLIKVYSKVEFKASEPT